MTAVGISKLDLMEPAMTRKKKSKSLLPKRVGGVKIPRSIRKGRAGRFLTSPLGVALISEAVMAAGVVTAVKKADEASTLGHLRDNAGEALRQARGGAKGRSRESAEALRSAFSAAAAAFADALHTSAEAIDASSKKSRARELQTH